MKRYLFILGVLWIFVGCQSLPAPTDEQIKGFSDQFIALYLKGTAEQWKAHEFYAQFDTLVRREREKYDLNKLQYKQLLQVADIWPNIYEMPATKNWWYPVLQKMATSDDPESVIAEIYVMDLKNEHTQVDTLLQRVYSRSLEPFLENRFYAKRLWRMVNFASFSTSPEKRGELVEKLLPYINSSLPEDVLGTFVTNIWDNLVFTPNFPKEIKLKTETCLTQALQEKLSQAHVNHKMLYYTLDIIQQSLTNDNSVIGLDLPALSLLWSSDSTVETWSDLKLNGKVALFHFFADWCPYSVQSFSAIKQLADRYAEYPVVILGISSPAREIYDMHEWNMGEEVKRFVALRDERGISWPWVLVEEPVFNRKYNIGMVPNVTLVDSAGKIVFSENPNELEIAKIAKRLDALLKEAGLKYPKTPMK